MISAPPVLLKEKEHADFLEKVLDLDSGYGCLSGHPRCLYNKMKSHTSTVRQSLFSTHTLLSAVEICTY